jgi:uncharacterized protein
MLLKFSVENYLSFKEPAIISFDPGTIKEYKENVFFPSFESSNPLLKCLGLFGKNASGKSNMIKAVAFMKDFVLNSSKESNATNLISATPFLLSTKTSNKPSVFEVTFFIQNEKFRYGFSVTEKSVVSEWLFCTSKIKEEVIFVRADQNYSFEKDFKNDFKKKLDFFTEITRTNSLFISVLAQFNNPIGTQVTTWFNDLIIAHDSSHSELIEFTARLMPVGDYRKLITDIIRKSDLGIDSIEEKQKEASAQKKFSSEFLNSVFNSDELNYTVKTKHSKFNEDNVLIEKVVFDLLQNESFGTQKFFGLLGPILYALRQRKILLIDEMDARMHFLLFENVIKIFNSIKYNPNGAQLVFTSHNTYILKRGLRRDQMILVEKDDYGASSIDSLYKKDPKVRKDASFDKDYLIGKYGAIPRLSSQLNLFEGL